MFWFWCIFVPFLVHFLWFLTFLKSVENVRKSKVGHESTLYCSDFDDFGVVWKLTISAFKRRQARQNPSNIISIPGHVWIWKLQKNLSHIEPIAYPYACYSAVRYKIHSSTWPRNGLISDDRFGTGFSLTDGDDRSAFASKCVRILLVTWFLI